MWVLILWLLQPDCGPGLAVLLRLPWGWRPPASLESGWDSAHAFLWLPQQLNQGWAHRETVYLTDGEVAEREPRSLPAGVQPLVGQAASLGSRCDQPALVSDPRRIAVGPVSGQGPVEGGVPWRSLPGMPGSSCLFLWWGYDWVLQV